MKTIFDMMFDCIQSKPCIYNDSGICEATGEYCKKKCDGFEPYISIDVAACKLAEKLFHVIKNTEK